MISITKIFFLFEDIIILKNKRMDLNITTLKIKNIPNFILKDKSKVEELFKQFGGVGN